MIGESLTNEPLYISGTLNAEDIQVNGQSDSLVSRLRLDPKKDADFVPLRAQLLRKYIAYARNFVFPR